MKATLGIGFEDRSPAFDFGIALTECRKVLGMEGGADPKGRATQLNQKMEADQKKDFSLKEGEKIHIQVGGKGRQAPPAPEVNNSSGDSAALFSIAPPPPAAAKSENVIPPPPSSVSGKSAQDLGFDDGEFGEFQ